MQDVWLPGSPKAYPTPRAAQFINADDFFALAVNAYLGAVRRLAPPRGEVWIEGGVTWGNAEDFRRHLLAEVGERLRRAAIAAGDLREVPWDDDVVDAGAGRSPADKAHGCAAFASAVGPAPAYVGEATDSAGVSERSQAQPADRFFSPVGAELATGPESSDRQQQQGGNLA